MKNTIVLKFFGALLICGIIIFVVYMTLLVESLEKNQPVQKFSFTSSSTNVSSSASGEISLQASPKREDAPAGTEYQVTGTGQRCALVDLNHYVPVKNEAEKTYTWIIEFPADPCVIQRPATNLPEKLVETQNENISGTNFRRTITKYE